MGSKSEEVFETPEAVRVSADLTSLGDVGPNTKKDSSSSHRTVLTIFRSNLPPGVIEPWESARTKPDISGRTFTLLAGRSLALVDESSSAGLTKDAWVMRDEFLNLKQDTEVLLRFLNRWGDLTDNLATSAGPYGNPSQLSIEFPHVAWQVQNQFRRALVGSPHKWLTTTAPLNLTRN